MLMRNIFQVTTVLLSFTLVSASFAYVDTENVNRSVNSLSKEQTQNIDATAREAANKKIAVSKPVEVAKDCRKVLKDVEVEKFNCEEDAYRTYVGQLKSCPANPTVRGVHADIAVVKVYAAVGEGDNCEALAEARLGEDKANCTFSSAKMKAVIGPCP